MRTANMVDEYLDQGWALCAIVPGEKYPLGKGWQMNPTDRALWEKHPDYGAGLIHGLSGTCALDLDDLKEAKALLEREGIDVDSLLAAGVQIVSGRPNRAKLLYRAPDGVELRRVAVRGSDGREVAYELRAGSCQDVLPPTLHPKTGKPYQWSGDFADLPELPSDVLALWTKAMKGKRDARAESAPVRQYAVKASGAGVIDRFNERADIGHVLELHGYVPSGSRWCAPDSTSGDPGVVLLPDSEPPRVYSHHASCPLADGHAHDAFSVWCILAHGGDVTEAVREAGEELDEDTDPMVKQWAAAALRAHAARRAEIVALPAARNEGEADRCDAISYVGGDIADDPGPCPVPMVDAIERWIASQLHAPKPGAVRQAALSLVCALTGRRYTTPYGHTASAYLAVTDTSAAALREIKPILYNLVAELGERKSIRGTSFGSASPVYRHLLRCPRIYWVTDELGHMARMARRQQSGAFESALAVLSELYDGRTMHLDPDSGARQKERPIEECDIFCPSMSLLAIIPHDLLGALAQRGEYGRGSLQQLLLAEAGDAPEGNQRDSGAKPPALLEGLANRLRETGGLPGTEDAPGVRPVQTKVWMDPEALAELSLVRGYMLDIMGDEHLRRWRGMAHGYHQTAIRLSCALAAIEDPEEPQVGVELARWVGGWVLRCLTQSVPRIETAQVDGEASDVYQRVMALLVDAGQRGMTSREVVQRCRPFRALSTEERSRLLSQMVEDGSARQVDQSRTVRYIGVSLFAKVSK